MTTYAHIVQSRKTLQDKVVTPLALDFGIATRGCDRSAHLDAPLCRSTSYVVAGAWRPH